MCIKMENKKLYEKIIKFKTKKKNIYTSIWNKKYFWLNGKQKKYIKWWKKVKVVVKMKQKNNTKNEESDFNL